MLRNLYKALTLSLFLFISSWPVKSDENKIDVAKNSLNSWLTAIGLASPTEGWELNVREIDVSSIPEHYKEICSEQRSICKMYEVSISFIHPEFPSSHGGGEVWNILNKDAMNIDGATLDERIIFKASHLLGVRADRINLSFHTYCLSYDASFIENKVQYVDGMICTMAQSSTLVAKTLVARDLSEKVSESLTKMPNDILGVSAIKGDDLAEIISNYYSDRNAKVKIIARDSHYVSAAITGLKKEVISSENYWESIQLSFLVSDMGESINIRTLVDGQYAAGLKEPSVLAYNDMEPIYTKELQQYAGYILESVKNTLLNRMGNDRE